MLFNLTADPYEHHDVAALHPDVVEAMLKRLAEIDTNLHFFEQDMSCPPRTPYNDSVVGPTWIPWCEGAP